MNNAGNTLRTNTSFRRTVSIWLTVVALICAATYGAIRLMESASLPTVSLTTLDGNRASLSALAGGKPLVLNLWASWCGPCRQEMPILAAAQRQEAGVTFVFANQGEDGITVQRFLAAAQLELANVLLDPGARIGRDAGSLALPITFFYDGSGQLVDTQMGGITAHSLAIKLDRIRSRAANS